jgi:hypothetical protein
MGFIAILAPLLLKLIQSLIPDPVAQANAKIQMQEVLNQAQAMQLDTQAKDMAAQADVVKAEIQGQSAMQRNWRPMLMYLFMFIIANNYILFPILHAVFPAIQMLVVPEQMWSLIDICVGGYVGGRSLEKIANTAFSDTKFFTVLKQKMGKLSQEQVDEINSSLAAAKQGD